jgi:hypothetical protein
LKFYLRKKRETYSEDRVKILKILAIVSALMFVTSCGHMGYKNSCCDKTKMSKACMDGQCKIDKSCCDSKCGKCDGKDSCKKNQCHLKNKKDCNDSSCNMKKKKACCDKKKT